MEYEDIIYEKTDGIATITINRPKKLNALRQKTWIETYNAIVDASTDCVIGVIVLTGSGDRAFCAGADQNEEETPEYRMMAKSLARGITNATKPVIAAVNGYAIGSGNWLAYICDFTIASENAIFGQTGPRVGSPPTGWNIPYLAWVVGEKRAREMWMMCRQYSAQDALKMGLVNMVVPTDKLAGEVEKWCKELLALSPTALKAAKASFNCATQLLYSSEPLEEWIAQPYIGSTESKEGVNAFLEKRSPDFGKYRK